MSAPRWRRRDILRTSAVGALAIAAFGLTSCATKAALAADRVDAETRATLERMARLLYPHDAISDEVYAEVVDGMLTAADAPTLALLEEAAASLSAATSGPWLQLPEAEQIAAMERIQSEPAFAAVQAGVRGRLYDHPAMWAHLGYPGPSLPFGGYLDRGFDDIDWLPANG
jgi:hypothetical protein